MGEILGIDISAWQGQDIDFAAVRAAGYRFCIIKATEGTGYTNPHLERHWRGVVDAGMFPGAYFFDRWLDPAAPQVAHFAHALQRVGGVVPGVLTPALDAEGYSVDPAKVPAHSRRLIGDKWYAWSPGATQRDSARALALHLREGLEAMEQAFNRWPAIYIGDGFYSDHLGHTAKGKRVFDPDSVALTSWPLWLPDYQPPMDVMPAPWRPLIWQRTGKGVVPGVKGPVDVNVFLGSEDDLRALAGLGPVGSQSLGSQSIAESDK